MGHLTGGDRFVVCAGPESVSSRLGRIGDALADTRPIGGTGPVRRVLQEPLRRMYVGLGQVRPVAPFVAFAGVAVRGHVRPSVTAGATGSSAVRDTNPIAACSDLSDFRGNFTAALRMASGELVVTADLLGSAPLFVARLHGLTFLGNDIWLLKDAAEGAGTPLTRDSTAFAVEATFGSGAFGLTGFREVRLVGMGEQYVIGTDGTCRSVRFREGSEWYDSDASSTELLEHAVSDIRESIRYLSAAGYTNRVADLTGGVDSRLVLAGLMAEEVEGEFLYTCSGDFPGADFTTYDYLSNVLSLEQGSLGLPFSGVNFFQDPLTSMRYLLYRTMGCSSHAFDPGFPSSQAADSLHLKGGFAETFKGFYSHGYSGGPPLDHLLRRRKWSDVSATLTREMREHLLSELRTYFATREAAGVSAEDMLDQWYIENRNRYHFGVTWTARLPAETTFHPLYSPAAVRLGFAEGSARRMAMAVAFLLMRELCDPLTFLPFAGTSWPPLQEHSEHDRVLYALAGPITASSSFPGDWHSGPSGRHAIRPLRSRRRGSHGAGQRSEWAQRQVARGRPYWEVAFGQVLPVARDAASMVGSDSTVWDVFDHDASKRVLARSIDDRWPHGSMQLVYKILAAAIWTEGAEQPEAPVIGRRSGGEG